MSDGKFVSADTIKIGEFQNKSPDIIERFNKIKEDFEKINSDLLSAWKGVGADAYKYETDHIFEKVGSVEAVLKAINESTVAGIRSTYSEFDEEMGKFNKDPKSEEG